MGDVAVATNRRQRCPACDALVHMEAHDCPGLLRGPARDWLLARLERRVARFLRVLDSTGEA